MDVPTPYTHHKPGPTAEVEMAQLRIAFASLHEKIQSMAAGNGREKALALTNLQQSAMWANLACVLADPKSKPVGSA